MRNFHFYLFFTFALLLSLCSIQKVTAQPRIYEIYNAGTISGSATWDADYVVLSGFTPNQNLSGWALQVRGSTATSWVNVIPLTGSADATGFYRVIWGTISPEPFTPSQTGIYSQMTNTGSGMLCLTNSTTAVGAQCTNVTTVDLVGYIGSTSGLQATCSEANASAPATVNAGTQSIRRKTAVDPNGIDTGNNANDFEVINDPYTATCTAPSIIVAASSNTPICSSATLNLSVTASGTAPLSYSWTGTGTFTGGTTATPSVTGAATGNYTATVYNACGNVTSIAAVVVNPSVGSPAFTVGATTLCVGGTSTYTATATNSTGITYSIVGGTGASIDPNSGVVSNVTGNFTVRASAAGCGGPLTVDQAVIVTPPVDIPSFTAGATTLCLGATSTYQATAANSTGITYSIFMGGASIDANTGVVSNVTSNFTVRATATGTCGSTTSDRSVIVNTLQATASITVARGTFINPAASAANPQLDRQYRSCEGDSIVAVANVSNSVQHRWMRNNSFLPAFDNAPSISIKASWGVYQLVAYDMNGCSTATDSIGFKINVTPIVKAGSDQSICLGGTKMIGATNAVVGITYTWTPSTHLNDANLAKPTVQNTFNATTTYAFQARRTYNELEVPVTCSSRFDSAKVTLEPLPAFPSIAASATNICQGDASIVLTPSNTAGATSVQWLKNGVVIGTSSNVSATRSVTSLPSSSGSYTAQVVSASGCSSLPSNSIALTINAAPTPTISPSVGQDINNVIKVCLGITNVTLNATTSAGTPTYTWFRTSPTTQIGTGNNVVLTNVTTTNRSYYVRATYVYGGLTCSKNSTTKTVRQDATATGCRLMQNGEEQEVELSNHLSAYPNPTQNLLTAKIQVVEAGEATLTLVNNLGQKVWCEKRTLEEGNTEMQLSLETLPTGVYILSFDKEGVHQTLKVVKE